MNDRELLEMAAKAAGIRKSTMDDGCEFYIGVATDHAWDPLIYDDDALQLAIKLCIDIMFFNGFQEVICCGQGDTDENIEETYGEDIHAAVRRCIVRAAAEIGRSMP